jgi:hypothetical protein
MAAYSLGYGVLCWVFLLLYRPVAFTAIYAALWAAATAALVFALCKWWGGLRQGDDATKLLATEERRR